MNNFFINRLTGIRQNGINKWFLYLLAVLCFFFVKPLPVQAATQTFTEPFQNVATSQSGQGIRTDMYFVKMGYWQVETAKLNLNFQVSQLADRTLSDLTVSINGVKFASFRPDNTSGLQTHSIDVPVNLIQGSNQLTVQGQVLTTDQGTVEKTQTPANWLTVYPQSNLNFTYTLDEPEPAIKSFYQHFSGQDTIAKGQAGIAVPTAPSNSELAAATYALAGYARVLSNAEEAIAIAPSDSETLANRPYQMVVARYDHLPSAVKQQIQTRDLNRGAVLQTVYTNGRYQLIVTAKTDTLLVKAARFVANQELMQETKATKKIITAKTQTFSSSLQDFGNHYALSPTDTTLTGSGHQQAVFFVKLPMDRTNADGSQINLNLRYAKNLDFSRSLVTASVDDRPIGSWRLTQAGANGKTITLTVPKNMPLANAVTIRIAVDLALPGTTTTTNDQTPWATIGEASEFRVKSKPQTGQLFRNYPTMFLKQGAFDHVAVVRPAQMTNTDFKTLTNIVNLLGSFAKRNTGTITYYDQAPSEAVLAANNVIAFGSPKATRLIQTLNPKLYFRYNGNFTRLVANEKLSIESAYGKTLGTAQLLRSPYNAAKTMLVVTGATADATFLGSTQMVTQPQIKAYRGDLIAVDPDNQHYDYRFKKQATTSTGSSVTKQLLQKRTLVIFLTVAAVMLVLLLAALIFLLRKYGTRAQEKGITNEKQNR